MEINTEECNPEVYARGVPVLLTHTVASEDMDAWCRTIAGETGEAIDWHCCAGRIVVKTTGPYYRMLAFARNHLSLLEAAQKRQYQKYGNDWRPSFTFTNPDGEPLP